VSRPSKRAPIWGINPTMLMIVAPTAAVLGALALVCVYNGLAIGGVVWFQKAQAFGGLAIAITSFLFIEFEPGLHARRFVAFHFLFVAGTGLVAPFIQSGVPFSTIECFEVGSFALLTTGFFITAIREENHNLLMYSATATAILFLAGMLSAFRDVSGVAAPSSGVDGLNAYLVTGMFLVGAIDLAILSVAILGVVVRRVRSIPEPEPTSKYGLSPIA